MLAQERLGTLWEHWETGEVISGFQVRSNLNITSSLWGSALFDISEWHLINFEWLSIGVVLVHTALSAWAAFFEGALRLLACAATASRH